MQGYFAIITIICLMAMVISRVFILKRQGIKAMQFGEMDKKDFLIPPFALLFFYLIIAHAFNLPKLGSMLFESWFVSWIGAAICIVGLIIFLISMISFGKSFRVGLDEQHPGKLITTGVFAYSRNPIYAAFGFILIGIFLIFPNWIFLIYIVLGFLVFSRQVLLEESSLKKQYGEEYTEYCKNVRRYF